MSIVFVPETYTYDSRPQWNRRTVTAHTPFTHNGREHRGQEFTIEKSEYGVEIEFQTGEGDFSRSFTHDEFNEFIRQCQWVSECPVTEWEVK